jgi:hypothetical protein
MTNRAERESQESFYEKSRTKAFELIETALRAGAALGSFRWVVIDEGPA